MDSINESSVAVTIVERLDTLERVVADFFVELIRDPDTDLNITVAAGKQLNRLLGVD